MRLLPTNIGSADRAVRFVVGLGLLALAFVGPKSLWGYLGIVPLLTAFVSSCPLYTLLGFSTCPVKK